MRKLRTSLHTCVNADNGMFGEQSTTMAMFARRPRLGVVPSGHMGIGVVVIGRARAQNIQQ